MTTDDAHRHEPDVPARPEQQEGEFSESARPEPQAGGADATDASTGTAPHEAGEPDA